MRGLVAGILLAQLSHVAQAPPSRSENLKFSHRFHLTQAKATCLDCHTAVVSSSSASDNNLPLEETCLQCHNGTKARKECTLCHIDPEKAKPFESPHRDFRFNHQRHLQFGNLAPLLASAIDQGSYLGRAGNIRKHLDTNNPCTACHRGLRETDFSSLNNLPQMADCLVCHTEIDPPFSCSFCHTPQAQIKPAGHTPDYIDSHSSTGFELDKPSCTICHGTNFRCMGCH